MDVVTQIFMVIGRSAPQHQSLAAYYMDSRELARGLMEYFTVVVELCYEIYMFSSGPEVQPAVDAIRAVTRTKCEKLDSWANSIQQSIALLNDSDRQKPGKDDKQPINMSVSAWSRKKRRYYQERKHNAYDTTSVLADQASWQHIRKQATTKSFLQEPIYQNWKRKKYSATLVCSGKPGIGKSTMLANVVDDLRTADHDSIVICYFCTYDEPKSLDPWKIWDSFEQQLLHAIPAKAFIGSPLPRHENSLVKYIKPLLSKAKVTRIFFVLDGLYHCSADTRTRVLHHLRNLQRDLHLLLCISAVDGSNEYEDLDPDASRLSVSINPLEMVRFITSELKHYQEAGILNIQDEESIAKIHEDASRLPEVSYPLVRLFLLYLCKFRAGDIKWLPSIEFPMNVLAWIPQLIRYVNTSHRTLQKLIKLAVVAVEPLTLNQIHDALGLDSHPTTLDVKPTFSDICGTLDHYDGFFSIDEERLTVHIAHRSIIEYVSNGSAIDNIVDIGIAHQEMAKICLRSLTNESHRKSSATEQDAELNSSPGKISQNHQYTPRSQEDLQLGDINSIESQMAMTTKTTSRLTISDFHAYASQYWLWHFIHIPAEDSETINLARPLFTKQNQKINHPGHPTQSLIEWALTNNHTTILSLALNSGMHTEAHPLLISAVLTNNLPTLHTLTSLFHFNLSTLTHDDKPLLWLAFEANHTQIFSHLVKHRATHFDHFDTADRSALWHAARTGETALVKRILDTGLADVNAMDVYAMTPLAAAVMGRHAEVVKLLLACPDINTRTLDDDLRTPLQTAELYGFESVARLLRAYEERVYGGVARWGSE